MAETKIVLTQEAFENPQESIQTLMEAAENIANASEKDFSEMKKSKWYNRLWKIITFSKDNEKKLANGVSNLAKLQEIIAKAILLLSNQIAETTEITKQNSELIKILCEKINDGEKTQAAIIQQLDRIISGVEVPLKLEDLSPENRIIMINALLNIANNLTSSVDGKAYLASVFKSAGFSVLDIQPGVNLEYIEELRPKEAILLYKMAMEYVYLSTNCFDCDSEILDYISINKKKANAIKENIKYAVSVLGKESLFNDSEDYDYTAINDDDIDFLLEEEIDFEETAETEEEQELENIVIDRMLSVGRGEVLKYSYKSIDFRSMIRCVGVIELDHCIITYRDMDYSNNISLCDCAKFIVNNCIFICKGFNENCFITLDDACEASFKHCSFKDCSTFLNANTSGTVSFEDCELLDCMRLFVNCWGNYGEGSFSASKIVIKNSNMAEFNVHTEDNRFDVSDSLFCVRLKDCVINEIYVKESPDFRLPLKNSDRLVDENNYLYFEIEKGVIYDSTFEGARNCIKGKRIDNCNFKNCKYAINTEAVSIYGLNKKEITNCFFDNCETAIHSGPTTSISQCRFVNSTGNIIATSYDGGMDVSFCEFINIKNDSVDKYQGFELSNPPANIVLGGSKKSATNTIKKCIFDGVDINEGFLIKANILEDPKGYVGEIEDCDFRNCTTNRLSGKIIKTYANYYGLFDKLKSTDAIWIDSCRGLDKINKQGNKCLDEPRPKNTGSKIAKNIGVAAVFALNPVAGAAALIGKAVIDKKEEEKYISQQMKLVEEAKKERNKKTAPKKATKSFMMKIEDVFVITGKGVEITGCVAEGEVTTGETLTFEKANGNTITAKAMRIEMYSKIVDKAVKGDNVGILLDTMEKSNFSRGDVAVIYFTDHVVSVADITKPQFAKDEDGKIAQIAILKYFQKYDKNVFEKADYEINSYIESSENAKILAESSEVMLFGNLKDYLDRVDSAELIEIKKLVEKIMENDVTAAKTNCYKRIQKYFDERGV